jgi:hypothetical protein
MGDAQTPLIMSGRLLMDEAKGNDCLRKAQDQKIEKRRSTKLRILAPYSLLLILSLFLCGAYDDAFVREQPPPQPYFTRVRLLFLQRFKKDVPWNH